MTPEGEQLVQTKNMRNVSALAVWVFAAVWTLAAAFPAAAPAAAPKPAPAPGRPVPVILDTDIGDDIDDTWALVMILKSPQLDLKLVTTTCGKAEYRAKLAAKLLTIAKRTDVAVGLGAGGRSGSGGQEPWVKDYRLADYAGRVHEDGVGALIDLLEASPRPIVVLSVGPSHTVAAALERKPSIASKAVLVGMQGGVRKGYDGGKVCAEYNVKANVPAAQKVLSAPWRQTVITPLDTCGLVRLSGQRFQTLAQSNDELVRALLENYRIWAKKDKVTASSVLFDTVAVYLAYPGPRKLAKMEDLPIKVTDQGVTAIDPAGAKMSVATEWKDLNGYCDLLVETLTAGKAPPRQ
jgi:inosine-uridine nucleoside N-ribohydrolase